MGLESNSITTISQLNPAYPEQGDLIREGDDHLRLIKSVLKTQFPGFNTPLTATSTQVDNVGNFFSVSQGIATAAGSLDCHHQLYMNGNIISNLGEPTVPTDAATAAYVNNNFYPIVGGTLRGNAGITGTLSVDDEVTFHKNLSVSTGNVNANGVVTTSDIIVGRNLQTSNIVSSTNVVTLTGALSVSDVITASSGILMNGSKISSLGDPAVPTDAANARYVQNNFFPISGGTFTGSISLGTHDISSVGGITASGNVNANGFVATNDAIIGRNLQVATITSATGTLTSAVNFKSNGGIFADGDSNFGGRVGVGGVLEVSNLTRLHGNVEVYTNLKVDGTSDFNNNAVFHGNVQAGSVYATSPINPGNQGLWLGWNTSNTQGEGNIKLNRGGGVGGIRFELVNGANTVVEGKATLTQNGHFIANGFTEQESGSSTFAGISGHSIVFPTNVGVPWGNPLDPGAGLNQYLEFLADGQSRGIPYFTSDIKHKENVEDSDLDHALEVVEKLPSRSFDWKGKGKHEDYGLIAQEVFEHYPQGVNHLSDGTMELAPSQMIGLLFASVKALTNEVKDLKAQLAKK